MHRDIGASLLSPAGESHVLTETSDDEIHQAVIDPIVAPENHWNLEIHRRDDSNEDISEIHPSSLHDALRVKATE